MYLHIPCIGVTNGRAMPYHAVCVCVLCVAARSTHFVCARDRSMLLLVAFAPLSLSLSLCLVCAIPATDTNKTPTEYQKKTNKNANKWNTTENNEQPRNEDGEKTMPFHCRRQLISIYLICGHNCRYSIFVWLLHAMRARTKTKNQCRPCNLLENTNGGGETNGRKRRWRRRRKRKRKEKLQNKKCDRTMKAKQIRRQAHKIVCIICRVCSFCKQKHHRSRYLFARYRLEAGHWNPAHGEIVHCVMTTQWADFGMCHHHHTKPFNVCIQFSLDFLDVFLKNIPTIWAAIHARILCARFDIECTHIFVDGHNFNLWHFGLWWIE